MRIGLAITTPAKPKPETKSNLLSANCHYSKTDPCYCRERWGIGRKYAWRVIGAAERVALLPAGGSTSEFQVRPFLGLERECFPKAWERVLECAGGGKVTLPVVRSVVREFSGKRKSPARRKGLRPLRGKILLGRVVALVQETRKRVERREMEQALETLGRIEKLLCGPPSDPHGQVRSST
jgi:hypothetical protein